MSKIILKNSKDQSNYSKKEIDIDNFRAVGELPNSIFIVTSSYGTFKIDGMTLKDFCNVLKMNVTICQCGSFIRVPIACQYCYGRGLTDWVTAVVGQKQERYISVKTDFKRDKKATLLKTPSDVFVKKSIVTYISRTIKDEALEYCKNCHGTGLFIVGYLMSDPEERRMIETVNEVGE